MEANQTYTPKYPISKELQADITNRFSYHAPKGDQTIRYEHIRACLRSAAIFLCENVPPGRERACALTHLQEAVLWANAGIACNEVEVLSNHR